MNRIAIAGVLLCTLGLMTPLSPSQPPPTPTPPPDGTGSDRQSLRPGANQPLLREGRQITQARGRIALDAASGKWRAVLDSPSQTTSQYVLTLLPGIYLADAQQVVEDAEQQLVFALSGEVFVYHNRNYLLLTHPPRVIAHGSDEDNTADEPASDDEPDDSPPRQSAEDVMRDLEGDSGPVQRRRPSAPAPNTTADDEDDADALREGSTIVMRRGRITREASGKWVFVFDADASGLSDPPLTLMPCLLTQRLERHAQRFGNAPVLLSGRVYTYDNTTYLLPTMFQRPRERTVLSP